MTDRPFDARNLPDEQGPLTFKDYVWAAQLSGYIQGLRQSGWFPARPEPFAMTAMERILRRLAAEHLKP